MGLLAEGVPLSWPDSLPHLAAVKRAGVLQFVGLYEKAQRCQRDCLNWGDEIEYMLVQFDDGARRCMLSPQAPALLAACTAGALPLVAVPEYARYMVETTPQTPYTHKLRSLAGVEANMRARRQLLQQQLPALQAAGTRLRVMSLVAFPRLGCTDGAPFLATGADGSSESNEATQSSCIPDRVISPHARFPALTRNIRLRRGRPVEIALPAFADAQTRVREVRMDAMAFGMGMCCLQVTFQACSLGEARYLYDQLAVVAPLLLALTAASPVQRGVLVDADARWNVVRDSVDDRTPEELRAGRPAKSRYDSVSSFLSEDARLNAAAFNDVPLETHAESLALLRARGVDEQMARHVAHLFVRDPLVVFAARLGGDEEGEDKSMEEGLQERKDKVLEERKEKVIGEKVTPSEKVTTKDNSSQRVISSEKVISSEEVISPEKVTSQKSPPSGLTDHFESLQSTNWQSVRFKPPPAATPAGLAVGYRVEFRTMEVGLTDAENAAFAVFTVLLARAVLAARGGADVDDRACAPLPVRADADEDLEGVVDLYMPLSLVDANMQAAQRRDAMRAERFWFRESTRYAAGDRRATLQSMDAIVNGTLVPLVRDYLARHAALHDLSGAERAQIDACVDLVARRADGSEPTTARRVREFVRGHAAYRMDSVVSDEIAYDLLKYLDSF